MNKSEQKNSTPPKAYLQTKKNTQKQRVIEYKIKHPHLSLKEIARKTQIKYSYVRQVWSQYLRKMITLKGSPISPLPLTIQNFGFSVDGSPRWYSDCPVVPSRNRNRQKVYRCAYYTMVIHSRGGALIHPYHEDWVKELRNWLDTWMLSTEVDMFIEYLTPLDQKHVCIPAPGVPKGYRFTVPGVGTMTTDGTPYKKGTLEFEWDPGVDKKIDGVESQLSRVGDSLEVFARGMEQHMVLIGELQEVSRSLNHAVKVLVEEQTLLRRDFLDSVSRLMDKLG